MPRICSRYVFCLSVSIVAALAIAAVSTILLAHLYEEHRYRRGIPQYLHRTCAQRFLWIQANYDSWWRRRQESTSGTTGPPTNVADIWDEFLKWSAAHTYSRIADYERAAEDGLTRFGVRGKDSYVEQFLVAVPANEENCSRYLAVAYVEFEWEGTVQRAMLAYSPTTPDRLFVAKATGAADLSRIFKRTVTSWNWSEPFSPPLQEWPDYYPLQGPFGPVDRLVPRPTED
jgi:hypothetical protein